MWALACMAQSLPANNSTHALRVLLVTCLVYVECVHGAYLLLPSAGCCKLWDLWFAACSLHTAQQLLVDHFVPPALEEGVVGGTLVAPCGLFHGGTNVVSHQLPLAV